jgi:hypothetical protein
VYQRFQESEAFKIKQNTRIKYIAIIMAKETQREQVKEETHELEHEEKDELEEENQKGEEIGDEFVK